MDDQNAADNVTNTSGYILGNIWRYIEDNFGPRRSRFWSGRRFSDFSSTTWVRTTQNYTDNVTRTPEDALER